MNSTKVDPVDWVIDLSHLNDRIENICIDFKKIEILLAIHIMNNIPKGYKELKWVIENKWIYLDELE